MKRGYKKSWNNRKIRRRRERQLHYGISILLLLLLITSLDEMLHGDKMQEALSDRLNERPEMSVESSEEIETETVKMISEKSEVKNPNIRVLIMTNGYKNTVHPEVRLSAKSGIELIRGKEKINLGKDNVIIRPDDKRFRKGMMRLRAKSGQITLNSIKRGYGKPSYEGIIELRTTAEGIVIINELPVESYLCKVVPSEMPSSYEAEALKAQAVCARSYAYRQMENYGYPEYKAHVNDSTDYQVYGNSTSAKRSSDAVKETKGQTVRYKGKIVTTYYYSTSGGQTTTMEAWGTKPGEKNGYLKSVKVKGKNGYYEKSLPWYRWNAKVSIKELSNAVSLNVGKNLGTLQKIEVTKRGPGNVAVELRATGNKGSVTVKTENKIRTALKGDYTIKKQDGSKTICGKLLPSAFFTVEKSGEYFVIRGRGYGHGIGMSQNGANEMAKQGKNYREILELFYQGTTVG